MQCRLAVVMVAIGLVSGCDGRDPAGPSDEPTPGILTSVPGHLALVQQDAHHAVLLDERGLFVNMVVTPSVYDALVGDELTNVSFQDPSRLLFQSLEDAFDWAIFTFDPDHPRTEAPVGAFSRVKNEVTGLSFPIFNNGWRWGGTERLGGVIMLQRPGNVRGGPSLHEILHQWGQTLLYDPDWYLHWGLTGVGGQLGGWVTGSLEEVEEGLYRGFGPTGRPFAPIANYGNRVPYAPWELYLMGLLPADSLHPVEVAVEGESVDILDGTFRASAIELRTPEEILGRHPPISPGWGEAPTAYRAVLVVLSTAPLDADATRTIGDDVATFTLDGDDGDAELFNFWEATGGRATLRMDGLARAVKPR